MKSGEEKWIYAINKKRQGNCSPGVQTFFFQLFTSSLYRRILNLGANPDSLDVHKLLYTEG
ncbi:MAG TPA: hypothetical protein DEV72_06740, partial [Ktedonobacter sp.]|nr:hypothetical protein [Ktedonobacter sp.]